MADKPSGKPSGSSDSLFFIGLIGIIVLALLGAPPDGTMRKKVNNSSSNESSDGDNIVGGVPQTSIQGVVSPWAGKVRIERGNSSSEYQPYKEYISLRSSGLKKGETVNITGWSLSNNKGARFYQINDTQVRGTSDRVYVPQAAKVFLTTGTNYQSPIIMKTGSKVVLLTGSVPNKSPFEVTNFQVNKCSGYIEDLDNYKLFPPLQSSCPDPREEIDLNSLDQSCYNFVQNLALCHTPEFPERTRVGDKWEYGYVDGVPGLSSQCKTVIKTRYNYNSCIALHGSDSDFLQNEWRVFLNRPWELWAKTRETITLYDNLGRVVNETSY